MANSKDNPENENLNDGNNADDNFGLPDLDYKPLDSTEEPTYSSSVSDEENDEQISESDESNQSYSYTPVEEPKSNAPLIIGLIIGLVLIVSAFLIYQYVYKPKAEKAQKELLAKQAADKKQKEEAARLAKEKEDEERRKAEAAKVVVPVTPSVGTIETLSERTGRYYVVIHSSLDDDLIMDTAKKLSAEGVSLHIIPPYSKKQLYRLAIGNFDSYEAAMQNVDEVKSKYGSGIWVIKY